MRFRWVTSTASDWEAILADLQAGWIDLVRVGNGALVVRV